MKTALVVWGGLELHEPEKGAHVVREILEGEGFEVTVTGDYAALGAEDVGRYDLIVPQVTGGELGGYASYQLTEMPTEAYFPGIGMPLSNLTATADRASPNALRYDFYTNMYTAADGPDYSYFPSESLLLYHGRQPR